jgi:hypothetical protein
LFFDFMAQSVFSHVREFIAEGILPRPRRIARSLRRLAASIARPTPAPPMRTTGDLAAAVRNGQLTPAEAAQFALDKGWDVPPWLEARPSPSVQELIAKRIKDNAELRQSPRFAGDMAKVGVTPEHIERMKEAPLGFEGPEQYQQLLAKLDAAVNEAGLPDAEVRSTGPAGAPTRRLRAFKATISAACARISAISSSCVGSDCESPFMNP